MAAFMRYINKLSAMQLTAEILLKLSNLAGKPVPPENLRVQYHTERYIVAAFVYSVII